jgi:hypothetical protein
MVEETYLGNYTFARQTKKGKWRLYQGARCRTSFKNWYGVVGREAVRYPQPYETRPVLAGTIREWDTLEAAEKWLKEAD